MSAGMIWRDAILLGGLGSLLYLVIVRCAFFLMDIWPARPSNPYLPGQDCLCDLEVGHDSACENARWEHHNGRQA